MELIDRKKGHGVCDYRRQRSFDNFLRRLAHPYEKILGPHVEPGMTVLDLGCGIGFNALGLAGLVGETGVVHALDIQEGALREVERRAARRGLERIVRIGLIRADDPGELPAADFALAFWMAHEVPDFDLFFGRVFEALAPGGRLLVAEPLFHVGEKTLQKELDAAGGAGFRLAERPRIWFCKSMLLEKPE